MAYKLTYKNQPVQVDLAEKDSDGNVIPSTYTKTDLSNASPGVTQAGKILKVSTTGGIEYSEAPAGGVTDVELDGESVVGEDGVADLDSEAIVTAAGLTFTEIV